MVPGASLCELIEFQSTPPRGRRGAPRREDRRRCQFQSTPPRGRRVVIQLTGNDLFAVSIHASAREASGAIENVVREQQVSIHASAREASVRYLFFAISGRKFQSTPPRGRRENFLCAIPAFNQFQSTPPRGRRAGQDQDLEPMVLFQSTPPRGRRAVTGRKCT